MQSVSKNKGWLALMVAKSLMGISDKDIYLSMIRDKNQTWHYVKTENDNHVFQCVVTEQYHIVHDDDLLFAALS